jgi:hypothetical protein
MQGLITGLLTLGQHARDRAAAGGNLLVRATLVPTARPIEIGHARSMGFGDSRSSRSWAQVPVTPAETSASLDEVASPGVPLVQTARLLADQIGQVFGIAEMKQVSANGVIQLRYWKGVDRSQVAAWAKANSLPTSMET